MIPGEIFPASGEIVLNKDKAADLSYSGEHGRQTDSGRQSLSLR